MFFTSNDKFGFATGIGLGGYYFGHLAGPPLGGITYVHYSIYGPIVIISVMCFLDLIGRLLIKDTFDKKSKNIDTYQLMNNTRIQPPTISVPLNNSKNPVTPEQPHEYKENSLDIPTQRNSVSRVRGTQDYSTSENILFPDSPDVKVQLNLSSTGPDLEPSNDASEDNPDPPPNPTPDPLSSLASPNTSPKPKINIWKLLAKVPVILIFILIAQDAVILGTFETTLSIWLEATQGYSAQTIGLVYISLIIPNIFGSVLGGIMYDKYGLKKALIPLLVGETISVFCMLLPHYFHHLGVLIPCLIILGFTTGYVYSATLPELNKYMPPEMACKMLSISNMVYSLGLLGGSLFGSSLYEHIGWVWEMVTLGILILPTIPLVLYYERISTQKKTSEEAVA